mgnify:CR=1 FL=1
MASFGSFIKNVTTAGTAVRLKATHFPVATFIIQPKVGNNANTSRNTGKVWVGGSDVTNDGTIGMCLGIPADNVAPERMEFHPTGANGYDLMDIWINSHVSGEGVEVIWTQL